MEKSKKYEFIVITLLYWTVFQDFALSLLLNITNAVTIVKILFFTKDILLLILFIWALIRKKIPCSVYLLLILYLSIITFHSCYSILNKIEFMKILASIRGWILMPAFIIIGYSIKNKKWFIRKVTTFFTVFMLVVAIFGIIDYVIDSYITSTIPLWTKYIGLGKFIDVIKGQGDGLWNGLPGNFYGQYGGEYFSQKRLVSFWGGPLTAAYVLALPATIFFLKIYNFKTKKWNIKHIFFFIITFLAICLSHTRAIILVLFALLIATGFIINKYIRRSVLLAIPFAIILIACKFSNIISFIYDGSTIEHIRQFTNSISLVSLFGKGVATFGVRNGIGTESAYISCIGQIGIFGLILYLIGNIFPLYIVYVKHKKYKKYTSTYLAILIVGIIMMISGLISEQLLAYTSIAPYYIILGFSLTYSPNLRSAESNAPYRYYIDEKISNKKINLVTEVKPV